MKNPNYRVEQDYPGHPLVVVDLGPWNEFPTITNATRELILLLEGEGLLTNGRRLLYYDSEGVLDEILLKYDEHGRPHFAGFAPGPGMES